MRFRGFRDLEPLEMTGLHKVGPPPADSAADQAEGRFLRAAALAMLVVGVLALVATLLLGSSFDLAVNLAAVLGTAGAFALLERGRQRWGGLLLIAMAAGGLWGMVLSDPSGPLHTLYLLALLLPVVLAFAVRHWAVGLALAILSLGYLAYDGVVLGHGVVEPLTVGTIFVAGAAVAVLAPVLRWKEGLRASQAEHALEAVRKDAGDSHASFESIVESAVDGILETTLEGRLVYINSAGVRILGYDSPDDLRQAIPRMQALYAEPGDRDRFIASVKAGAPGGFKTWLLARDGRRVPVSLTARLVTRSDGESRLLGVMHDRTTEVHEEELLRDRRSAQEEQERHRAEVARLRETSEMRMQFLNVAAHDLNTPLTPVLLQLASLRRDKDLANGHGEALALLERNIRRLQVLVQDMLDSARLQGGRLKVVPAEADLAPLVADAVKAFEGQAQAAGVAIHLEPFEGKVYGDAAKLSQVLYNLVSNAVKYTRPGGRVAIRARRNGQALELDVEDTGLGLTGDQIARMFAPFARFHEGVPGVPKGTGLGLYISKGIMDQHGGALRVASAGPGKGARFTLAVPLWTGQRPATADQDGPVPRSGIPALAPRPPGGGG